MMSKLPNDQVLPDFFCRECDEAVFDLIRLNLVAAVLDRDGNSCAKPAGIVFFRSDCSIRQLPGFPLNIDFKSAACSSANAANHLSA
jgi:hypothetical protein